LAHKPQTRRTTWVCNAKVDGVVIVTPLGLTFQFLPMVFWNDEIEIEAPRRPPPLIDERIGIRAKSAVTDVELTAEDWPFQKNAELKSGVMNAVADIWRSSLRAGVKTSARLGPSAETGLSAAA